MDTTQKIYYESIDKVYKRKDLWKAFPFPAHLLYTIRSLTLEHTDYYFNTYIETFTHQSQRYELIGPDTINNIIEKAKEC